MHKHLQRQLKRASIGGQVDLPALLALVDDYYQAIDRERRMTDHSIRLMSNELMALNRRIREQGEARFRAAVDNVQEAIITVCAMGKIESINPAAARMFGCGADDMTGQPITGLIQPSPAGSSETSARRADGQTFPVEFSVAMMNFDGRLSRIYTLRDITERRQAEASRKQYLEELASSNAELERFAYVASHDLQEPLRSIVSFLGLLKRRQAAVLSPEGLEYMGFITDAARHMSEMIRGMLEYSRVRGSTLNVTPVDLNKSVADAAKDLDAALGQCGGRITASDLPVVMADAMQLHRVLLNLVGNAVKYRTANTPPLIHIHALPHSSPDLWEIRVDDNGIGIPTPERARIFELFHRVNRQDGIPGTGIGLAMCQKIVQSHGGGIWVDASPAGGSSFRFTLPAAPS